MIRRWRDRRAAKRGARVLLTFRQIRNTPGVTRRSLGSVLLALLTHLASKGAPVTSTPPEPDLTEPEPTEEPEPQSRPPYEEGH